MNNYSLLKMSSTRKWIRRGKILDRNTIDIDWFKLNVQLPIPILFNNSDDGAKDFIRIYVTFCDEYNRGRLGYVDVDAENPSKILGYSKRPLLDIGMTGCFDESGVVATSLLKYKEAYYIYYCGYQKQINIPYTSLMGIAMSKDQGKSFFRIKETPVLERSDEELFIRTGAGIYQLGDSFRLYYAAGSNWMDLSGHRVPKYSLKYIDSGSPVSFTGKSKDLFQLSDDEFGMTTPQINKTDDGLYEMIYSIRASSYGYRMGYAISKDATSFHRKDFVLDIPRVENEFDSEMICYGKIFRYHNRIYLFYSGNHYGIGGLGWAEFI